MTQQERLRQFTKERGLTQTELAEALGLTQESVSRIMTGKQELTERFIGKFFLAYGPAATAAIFAGASTAETPA